MKTSSRFEFPAEQEAIFEKARRVEWITIGYIASAATAMFFTMGASQAMRTSFFEDLISFVPALAFLIGSAIARREPDRQYPYGYHRATSIGYLTASLALFVMGSILLIEAVLKAAHQERTTIGVMKIGDATLWAGWPMLAAVTYSAAGAAVFGRVKARLAPRIHDKVLTAQADMMKADWMAALATAIGVLGVGFGYWWVDPLAAALVSSDIIKDGVVNLKAAAADLIDRVPFDTERKGPEHASRELAEWLKQRDWVAAAEVRLREEGHVFFGEAFVAPVDGTPELPRKVREAMQQVKNLDWRLHDVTISVVDDPERVFED